MKKAIFVNKEYYSLYDSASRRLLINEQEMKFLHTILPIMIVKPAFSGQRLFEDFTKTLKSNGLIDKEELRDFQNLSAFVQLFALTVMHRSEILMQDGSKGSLAVRLDDGTNNGCITLALTLTLINDPKEVRIRTPLFSTDLKAEEFCSDAVMQADDRITSGVSLDQLLLEVASSGKLTLL